MTESLGYIATVLFTLILVPQFMKTYISKDITGVSLGSYIILLVANIIALMYAVMIKQNPLVLKYSVAIVIVIAYLILFFKVKGCHDHSK